MVDRIHSLSPNVTIAATDPNPLRRPLSAQFPRCVLVRNAVMQANAKKHMLFRVRPETGFVATMRSSHQLWYHQENATATATGKGVKCRHNKLGLFDHYAWSMEHIHLLYVKAGRYIGDADRTERYSKLIKLVEQNEVTGGWSFSEGASKQLSKNILCCPQPHTTGSGKEAGKWQIVWFWDRFWGSRWFSLFDFLTMGVLDLLVAFCLRQQYPATCGSECTQKKNKEYYSVMSRQQ